MTPDMLNQTAPEAGEARSAGFETDALLAEFGTEVKGLDLRSGLPEDVRKGLCDLLRERHVLLFRNQELGPEEQIAFLSTFGTVLDEESDGTRHCYISSEVGSLVRPGRLLFHMDNHYTPVPLEALSLYAAAIEGPCGPTLFADTARIVDRLPGELLDRIADRRAENVSYYFFGVSSDTPARSVDNAHADAPRARHPVIDRHPVTGERHLLVSELHTDQIVGMDRQESSALLDEVYGHLYGEGNVYEYHWRAGDILVWDNRFCQHARGPEEGPVAEGVVARRTLRRVVTGTRTQNEQIPVHIRQRSR